MVFLMIFEGPKSFFQGEYRLSMRRNLLISALNSEFYFLLSESGKFQPIFYGFFVRSGYPSSS